MYSLSGGRRWDIVDKRRYPDRDRTKAQKGRPSITVVLSLSTDVFIVSGKEVGHRRQTQILGQGQDALASIAELVVKK